MYNKQLARGKKSHECDSDSDDIPKKNKRHQVFNPEFHFSDGLTVGVDSKFIGQGLSFDSRTPTNSTGFLAVAYPICHDTTITRLIANIKFLTNINATATFFLVSAPCPVRGESAELTVSPPNGLVIAVVDGLAGSFACGIADIGPLNLTAGTLLAVFV